jgi:hypothetical protein
MIELTESSEDFIDASSIQSNVSSNISSQNYMSASDMPLVDQKLLDDYYYVKLQLTKWEKEEDALKERIKRLMHDRNIKNINSQNMFLSCHTVERVTYPKNKVEEFIPQELLEKIKTIKECIVLQARLK